MLHAARAGQPTALAKASRASQGEDFSVDILGQVHDFYKAGLVSGALNALHGGLFVYEIEYTPGGSPSSTGTYYALISAATNRNFNRPYALTALVPGFPLVTAPLATGGLVLPHQLWSAEQGVLAAH